MKNDLLYIADRYFQGLKLTPFTVSRMQKLRIYERVLSLKEYKLWNAKEHEALLIEHLSTSAKSWMNTRALFDAAIEYLSIQQIVIPGYSTLQKIISRVFNRELDNFVEQINDLISKELDLVLMGFIGNEGPMTIKQLRQSAKNFTATELEKELTVHRHIHASMPEVQQLLDSLNLSLKNQNHFAERVDYYGAKLRRQAPGRQRLYLLCYLHYRWQQALERIADGFVYHVRRIKLQAQVHAREAVFQDWQKASRNVSRAADVLYLFVDDAVDQQQPFGKVRKHALTLLDARELESVCLFLNDQRRSNEESVWLYYDQKSGLRALLRALFLCLRFEGGEGTQRLVASLSQAQHDFAAAGTLKHVDMRLPHKRQLPFLQGSEENERVNRVRFEWFIYLQIPNRLNGQLTLPQIIKYRALDADLVSQKRWKSDKNTLLEQTQLPKMMSDPIALIGDMADKLDSRLEQVSDYLERADNRNIILRNPKGKRLWRLPGGGKKHLVNSRFFQQMPATGIADVLRIVDRDTGFIDCFEHVLGVRKSRNHEQDLLAILIGNATNQGIYGISQISDRTYEQLSGIQANYLSLDTLNAANDFINNATAKLPIFKHYNIQGDIIHASADGQKFEARRETFKTRYSSKYFGTQKGVSSLSLIANHAAINARVIGANEHESHFIFDLLHNNTTEIVPEVLSTDTHGVNHVNFALLDLFGYSFAPRYAQVGRVINEMFDVREDKTGKVQLRLKKPIVTNKINKHWDTIQRIVVSLKRRQTTQATLVRKLSCYKKNHPLLEALTEYNRMVKANYLLNYIDDASLRNYVQRALNRGEAYHQLRRAISNVNVNQFRGSSDEEIMLWNECARLLANAIIYFNSVVLSHLLLSFERQGDEKKIDIVKKASPVAWHNINLKGTYNFKLSKELPDLDDLMRKIEGYVPVLE